jgi:DNA-binding NtrC family response regulator
MVSDFDAAQSGFNEDGMVPRARNSTHVPEKSAARRILVVDDEALIRWTLVETLGERGYEVVEAADGRGALLAMGRESAPFDAVLLDFRLPDSSDLGLLAALQALGPATPIILMTAFGTPEVTEQALKLGAFRVVSKPFALSEMAALVLEAQASRPC